jgi:molecular chaperone GrpE
VAEEREADDGSAKQPPDGPGLSEDIAHAGHIGEVSAAEQDVAALSNELHHWRTANEELKQQLLQMLADTENFLQEADRDKEDTRKNAIFTFAGGMVGVADQIRRTIEAVPQERQSAAPAVKNLIEGVKVTERALLGALNRYQVARFDPLGETFDSQLHDAKIKMSAPNVPANTVIHVIHAGYMIGEHVLRPASVIVAQPKWSGSSIFDSAPVPAMKITNSPQPGQTAGNDSRPATIFHRPAANGNGARQYAEAPATEVQRKPAMLHRPVISAAEGVPPVTHPVWERLVTGQIKHRFKMFAANMLIDRARREYANNRSAKPRLASELCNFFHRYVHLTAAELQPLIAATGAIPAASHPIWERLVTGQIKHRFKLFAANMLIDRAKREYASNKGTKAKLANDLCKFFNGHADLTAAELGMIVSKETIWVNY